MTTLIHRVLDRVRSARGPDRTFPALFVKFKEILALNNQVLERVAEANHMLSGDYVFDRQYIRAVCEDITALVERLVYNLDSLAPGKYPVLHTVFNRIQQEIEDELSGRLPRLSGKLVVPYTEITSDDTPDVGGKNATLGELGQALGITTPAGFAITASAFRMFLEHNDLEALVEAVFAKLENDSPGLRETARALRERIIGGGMPELLKKEISEQVEQLAGKGARLFAVRSSAVGEDDVQSFAGQYLSLLNVIPTELDRAYREVLASLFREGALVYARQLNVENREIAMPVACQRIVPAKVSGVLYTLDPRAPGDDKMLINATWGMGAGAVSGEARADEFTVSRRSPHGTTAMSVVRKETALRPGSGGGITADPVAAVTQTKPALTPGQIRRLAETGLRIEQYFRKPQDIEFAFDSHGELVILQARPLELSPRRNVRAPELSDLLRRYPILMRNQGVIAQRGIASGKVRIVRSDDDLDAFPYGAILVARHASPVFAKVLARAAGVITEVGAATGHLATVAREFRVPAIVNCGDAIRMLEEGMEITMDAEDNIVYRGEVPELSGFNLGQEPMESTPEYRLLRRLLKKIEPLRLLDPAERSFTPAACRSLHDITRFVHEKAVEALIDFHVYSTASPGSVSGRLQGEVPLDMVVIDIGGGLEPHATGALSAEDVSSVPMQALIEGITIPGAWSNEPMPVDFGGFMSSLTRTFSTELAQPRHVGQNLAVVSREYANVSLRLGYHFTMIDAYVSDRIGDNYAYFRFFGGVTEETRRSRRARLLAEILVAHDFKVEVQGDLVIGRVKKLDAERMYKRLVLLGALVGFTRQLDVRMVDEGRIPEFVGQFKSLLGGKP